MSPLPTVCSIIAPIIDSISTLHRGVVDCYVLDSTAFVLVDTAQHVLQKLLRARPSIDYLWQVRSSVFR